MFVTRVFEQCPYRVSSRIAQALPLPLRHMSFLFSTTRVGTEKPGERFGGQNPHDLVDRQWLYQK